MYKVNKGFFRKLSLLLAVIMVVGALFAAPGVNPAGASGAPINSAVQYLYHEYTTNSLVNNDLGVGSYALYVLCQAGVDVTTWKHGGTSLDEAVKTAIADDISKAADPFSVSAKLLAQDLAAADALGESDLADQLAQILQGRESSAGFNGSPYSDIPAYDLLGRAGKLSVADEVYAKECILAAQETTVSDAAYGSFGGTWEDVFYPDFMTTAHAVRALQYLDPDGSDSEIQGAIGAALNWIKAQQQGDGSFLGSAWDDPVIDTAEVVVALDALGMNPETWNSGGNTAVDYMMNDALNDDGSFGTSKNVMDATWALCAYNALGEQCTVWRFYLDPASTELNVDGTKQMTAVWQNVEGSSDVTLDAVWSVADDTIASVDSGGLVTALAAGETKVNAAYNGLTASAKVTVRSSSSGGGNDGTEITVSLAVAGRDNELLYGPSRVSVDKSNKWGLTALGALDAAGIAYETSSWSYGDLVYSIEGLSNSGMSGWMYTVNGSVPGLGADKYNINNKDKIIFYYSESMDQQPPVWDELGKRPAAGGGVSSAGLPEPVRDSNLNAAIKNAGATGQVALAADDNGALLVLSSGQIAKILDAGVPLAVTIQGAQFILSPDCLKVKEMTADQTAMIKFAAQKLSSEDAQELTRPFAARLKLAGEIYELTIQVLDKDGTLRDIAHFPGCMVFLPVPAGLEEGAAGSLKAYRYNEDSGQWEDMGGIYDPVRGVVGFNVDHFSKYALLETVRQPVEKIVFIDTVGHWAQAEIEYMAAAGYVAGVGGNQFAPEVKITRAEFTAILARMAGLADNNGTAGRFSDVPAGAWYRGMVGAATTAGLVCGTSENSFAPDEPVTREQMAAMMVRFIAKNGVGMTAGEAGEAGLLAGFGDSAEISPWASTPVALAVRDGLMVGREEGRFVPLGSATRAEATVVLYRVLQKLPQLEK